MTAAPPDIEHDDIAMQTGPGQQLHAARRAASLSIADVAAQLHLDASTIEALERDDYGRLPAPAFVRGYLRSYARLVNLAPGPVVDAYTSQGFEPPALVADISSGAHGQSDSTDLPWQLMTYLIAGVVVTLVVLWWRSNMSDPFSVLDEVVGISQRAPVGTTPSSDALLAPEAADRSPDPSGIPTPATVVTTAQPDTASAAPDTSPSFQSAVVTDVTRPPPATAPGSAGISSQPPAAAGSAPGTVAAAPPSLAMPVSDTPAATPAAAAAEPVDAMPEPAPPVAAESTAAAAATRPGELHLAFTHDSWVEVYDADGTRLFFGMARAGRDMTLSGTAPLKVLLGYARDIRVEYNGGLLDYAAFVNRGIARFIVTADGISGEPAAAGAQTATQQ